MAGARGTLCVTLGGDEYTLFLGMSVIADLQDKHGQDVLEKLQPPAGAGPNWVPDLGLVVDVVQGALQRHHSDTADRWLVDDILAEHAEVLGELMGAAFPAPQAEAEPGNAGKPKKAA